MLTKVTLAIGYIEITAAGAEHEKEGIQTDNGRIK